MTKRCQLLSVPNDEEGTFFLYLLDKYLNKESYSIRKRGRHPVKEKVEEAFGKRAAKRMIRHMNLVGSIPQKYAGYLGIYLVAKTDKGYVQIDIGTAHELEEIHEKRRENFTMKCKLEKIKKVVEE